MQKMLFQYGKKGDIGNTFSMYWLKGLRIIEENTKAAPIYTKSGQLM